MTYQFDCYKNGEYTPIRMVLDENEDPAEYAESFRADGYDVYRWFLW